MRTLSTLLIACSLLVGSARGGPPEPLTMTVQLDALEAGALASRPVKPGTALRSGDRIALQVKVSAPSYVYMIWFAQKRWSALVYPKGKPAQLQAGGTLRVPEGTRWLTLDREVGQENLYLLASRTPISASAALCERLRLHCVGGEFRGGDDPPPPPEGRDQRGPPTADPASVQQRVREGKSGIAELRFHFEHQ